MFYNAEFAFVRQSYFTILATSKLPAGIKGRKSSDSNHSVADSCVNKSCAALRSQVLNIASFSSE